METYALAELVLNLVSIGMQHQEIMARLDAAKQSGVPDSEVPALIKKWCDEAIEKASIA